MWLLHMGVYRGQERASLDSLELELEEFVSHPLGTGIPTLVLREIAYLNLVCIDWLYLS